MPTSCQTVLLQVLETRASGAQIFVQKKCVVLLHEIQNKISLMLLCYPLQLRSIPVKGAEDDELEEEADWIYRNAFATPTISLQVPCKKRAYVLT